MTVHSAMAVDIKRVLPITSACIHVESTFYEPAKMKKLFVIAALAMTLDAMGTAHAAHLAFSTDDIYLGVSGAQSSKRDPTLLMRDGGIIGGGGEIHFGHWLLSDSGGFRLGAEMENINTIHRGTDSTKLDFDGVNSASIAARLARDIGRFRLSARVGFARFGEYQPASPDRVAYRKYVDEEETKNKRKYENEQKNNSNPRNRIYKKKNEAEDGSFGQYGEESLALGALIGADVAYRFTENMSVHAAWTKLIGVQQYVYDGRNVAPENRNSPSIFSIGLEYDF